MNSNFSCKKCDFTTTGPSPLHQHYVANASHRPAYWNKRHSAPSQKRHLSVVGSKVKIGHEVGFHKNGRGGKSQLAKLQAELQAAINESAAKLEKLRFAHELLQSGKVGA